MIVHNMKIIGGVKRGAKLATCTSPAVRPTAQRTREALFNILAGGRFGLSLGGAVVIDLFAGTGAIGLEALSRGAMQCIFVEQNKEALKTLSANISRLEFEEQAIVSKKDVRSITKWVLPPADFVFADPPYNSQLADQGLEQLYHAGAIRPHAVVAVETRKIESCQLSTNFTLTDSRTYGMAKLSFFKLATNLNAV